MKLDLYTDGSYTKVLPDMTSGGMVLLNEGVLLCAQRYTSKWDVLASMNNVGGELLAAAAGMFVAGAILQNYTGKNAANGTIRIYHDYRGISEFIIGTPPWIPRKAGSKYYVRSIQEFMKTYSGIKLEFIKVKAHSGNKWNTLADTIAGGFDPIECIGKMLPEYVL